MAPWKSGGGKELIAQSEQLNIPFEGWLHCCSSR